MSQTPQVELDHIMLRVSDLEATRAGWQRLGFTVSPYRTNEAMGGGATGGRGGNHLVLFTPPTPGTANFLELAYADPAHAHPIMKSLLEGPPGYAMMVHITPDLERVLRGWEAAGVPYPPAIYELGSEFRDPGTGSVERIHFRVSLPSSTGTSININAYTPRDLAHFLRPDWRSHANGASCWRKLTIAVDQNEFAKIAMLFSRIYGAAATVSEGSVTAKPAEIAWQVVTSAAAEKLYPLPFTTAIEIEVNDLHRVSEVLQANGISAVAGDGCLCAAVPNMDDTVVAFVAAS